MDSRAEPTKAAATGDAAPLQVERWLLALQWRELWLDQLAARLPATPDTPSPRAGACRRLLDAMLASLAEPLPAPLADAAARLHTSLPQSPEATLSREELWHFDRVVHDLFQWLIMPLRTEPWHGRAPRVPDPGPRQGQP